MSFMSQIQIANVCDDVKTLLLQKNEKYGDSALHPIRILSKSSATEQILVRIDDKLNRIKQGNLLEDDEDVVTDLIGYFVLLKVALQNDYNEQNSPLHDVSFSGNGINSQEPVYDQSVNLD